VIRSMFARVLITECIKLRRTLALGLVVICPLVIVMLYFFIGYFGAARPAGGGPDLWRELVRNTLGLWAVLMMPLFIALETALLADIEHGPGNWKSLLALPPPRWVFFAAKLVVAIAMLCGAHLVLAAGTLASGAILRELRPDLHVGAVPWRSFLETMATLSLATLLALSIQHVVSLRCQTFSAALAFGIAAVVLGFVAVNAPDFGRWYPWSMPMHAIRGALVDQARTVVAVSVAGTFVVAALGAWQFSRMER